MGKTADVLSVGEKHESAGKQKGECEGRDKARNNWKSLEAQRPTGIYPADNLIGNDHKEELHSNSARKNKGKNKTYPKKLAIIFAHYLSRCKRPLFVRHFINFQINLIIEKYFDTIFVYSFVSIFDLKDEVLI